MKANVDEEIEASSNALQKLNSKIEDSICFTLPVEQSKRTIIKIRKFSKTDKKFPRKYNEIKKDLYKLQFSRFFLLFPKKSCNISQNIV